MRCSTLSAAVGEPPSATAPVARRWLAIEQAGPWGRDALLESHLDRRVAEELARRSAAADVKIVMIRRAGRHPDLGRPMPRRVYLADTTPGSARLTEAVVDEPADLLDLDLADGFGNSSEEPLVLVCTNARRDRCCAIEGRPLATALATGFTVWECSHLGGHRFAPTMLLLPHGLTYGRQTVASATQAIDFAKAGQVTLDRYRGRTTWPRAGQAAEIAVMAATGERHHDALSVELTAASDGGPWFAEVRHRDGRAWLAEVVRDESGDVRPESCGRIPVPMEVYRTVSLEDAEVSGRV